MNKLYQTPPKMLKMTETDGFHTHFETFSAFLTKTEEKQIFIFFLK